MNAPRLPTLLLKNTKNDIYRQKDNIKKYLLESAGFKSIQEAKRVLGVKKIQEVYEPLLQELNIMVDIENKILMNKYNEDIKKYNQEQNKLLNAKAKTETKQKKEIAKRINNKKRENRQRRKKSFIQKTIMINAVLEVIYIYSGDFNGVPITKYSKPYIERITLGPMDIREDLINDNNIIDLIERHPIFRDPYKIVKYISHTINVMDTKILNESYNKPQSKRMMKNAFILKNDWLKYAESISPEAYKNTNGECVYYQLEKFLLTPPAGNPTKFLFGKRINKDTLFNYFNSNYDAEDRDSFNIKSGVNVEMLAKLCKDLKRNIYVYDNKDNCFFNNISFDSKNYCPLTFYSTNGHFYLINDKEATKSIAESNKIQSKKIKSSMIKEENTKGEETPEHQDITQIEYFDIENALNIETGIYLLQQSNLSEEVIQFITEYKTLPLTKNRDNVIINIKFKNNRNENVEICVDANYGKNINYLQLKEIADYNYIKYVNEGIGSVVYKIIQEKLRPPPLMENEEGEFIEYNEDEYLKINNLTKEDLLNGAEIIKYKQPDYDLNNFISSTFNDIVIEQIFNTSHFKSFQFVEKIEYDKELVSNLNFFKIDMNKCRRNNLYYSTFEFPVYSIMDMPAKYNGVIKCGMYYISTKNTFPFRGCGWYFEPLIQYGLTNNLITQENILYEFIPYNTLPSDYFKTHIDILLDAFDYEKIEKTVQVHSPLFKMKEHTNEEIQQLKGLQKTAINSLIGVWGITTQTTCKTEFSLCPYEASNWYSNAQKHQKVFIKNHIIDDDNIIYEGLINEDIIAEKTNYCLYSMILQMEALELHKIETLILRQNGIPLDRNTDAIRYASKTEINIKPYYWDKKQKVNKYKAEEPKELQIEKIKDFKRPDISDTFDFGLKWNIQNGYENMDIESFVISIIESNKSYHIDGRAGTGKTYLVNKIVEQLMTNPDFETEKKKIIGVSPTNKGARLIDGNTIHTYYNKFSRNKYALFKFLEKVEYIFIDEVSMMIEKFYTLFIMIKRALPHIKFIISGDFGQLPPVLDTWSGDYENSAGLWSLCDGNKILLTEFKRGDKELFVLCKNVNKINIDNFKPTQKTYLNLAYTHTTRQRVNNECMERFLQENNKLNYYTILKDEKNEKTQDVKLCVGMPVISHITDGKLNIINSQTYKIIEINDETFTLEGNEKILIKNKFFHKCFYLGFCITIHASQGETYKTPYTIYDWNFYHFNEKAKYVALSRATDIKNIQIAPDEANQKPKFTPI